MQVPTTLGASYVSFSSLILSSLLTSYEFGHMSVQKWPKNPECDTTIIETYIHTMYKAPDFFLKSRIYKHLLPNTTQKSKFNNQMPTGQNSTCTRHNHNRLSIINNHTRTLNHIANLQFIKEINGGMVYPTEFIEIDAVVSF